MGDGIGRNDPCWCGSGKKYKKCHLNRGEEAKLEPWEADKGLQQHFAAKRCVVPDELRGSCSGNIVRAHTVPKSGSLQRIARDGHVYAFSASVQRLASTGGVLVPKLHGVNRASTFTGFCSHHDNAIFAPIEDAVIDFSSEQCFLLGYRAVCREYFMKQAQFESLGFLRGSDKGRDLKDQVGIQHFVSEIEVGLATGTDDVRRHKSQYDAILLSHDYSTVRSCVMTFHNVPTVMCSGGSFPYEDFEGKKAQDLLDLNAPAQAIYFTSFAAGDVGAVVFTWLPESDPACLQFVGSLERIPDEELSNALIRFFFEYSENVQIAPKWWDGLDKSARNSLVRRLTDAANVRVERRADCLRKDGKQLGEWRVRERFMVGSGEGSLAD